MEKAILVAYPQKDLGMVYNFMDLDLNILFFGFNKDYMNSVEEAAKSYLRFVGKQSLKKNSLSVYVFDCNDFDDFEIVEYEVYVFDVCSLLFASEVIRYLNSHGLLSFFLREKISFTSGELSKNTYKFRLILEVSRNSNDICYKSKDYSDNVLFWRCFDNWDVAFNYAAGELLSFCEENDLKVSDICVYVADIDSLRFALDIRSLLEDHGFESFAIKSKQPFYKN